MNLNTILLTQVETGIQCLRAMGFKQVPNHTVNATLDLSLQ